VAQTSRRPPHRPQVLARAHPAAMNACSSKIKAAAFN
jgi:hypothetical protein